LAVGILTAALQRLSVGNRTITGQVSGNGFPLANRVVSFTLLDGSYTSATQYIQHETTAITDELGDFTATLWANGEGEVETQYKCTLPDGETFLFVLPAGTTPITLSELRGSGYSSSVGGSASTYNLLIEQGATFRRVLQFKNDGVLVDPSSWTIRSQIRASYSDSVALATFDITKTATDVTILLSATQTALLLPNYYRNRDTYKATQSFPHADPSTLPANAYVWDLEVDEGSVTYRRLEGGVLVTPEVTQ
jgi:hypothetical protein